MGRRNISDWEEFNRDSGDRLIYRMIKPRPFHLPYTADRSDLLGEYHKPRSPDEV